MRRRWIAVRSSLPWLCGLALVCGCEPITRGGPGSGDESDGPAALDLSASPKDADWIDEDGDTGGEGGAFHPHHDFALPPDLRADLAVAADLAPPMDLAVPPDAAVKVADLAAPLPDVAMGPPDVAMPPPDKAMPPPDKAVPPLDVAMAPPDVAMAPPDVAMLPPDVAMAPPDLAKPDLAPPADLAKPADLGMCSGVVSAAQSSTPAAMLVLLARNESMAQGNKWAVSVQAIETTLDQDLFNSMYVGLYSAPSGTIPGPLCIFNLPVSCVAPMKPQVPLALAGLLKSTDNMGVRKSIKTWLDATSPDMDGIGDATPLYAALQYALADLQAWKQVGKRILFVVTDGTFNCNQFSNRPGYPDCNGCNRDWEDPNNVVALIAKANTDPNFPVETFVLGVPGADTFDATGCNFPPYHMRLALSSFAWAGSPAFAPQTCTGKMYTKNGLDPAISCHFDLTQGNFDVKSVADRIDLIRSKVQGCTFDIPNGANQAQINVILTLNGKDQTPFRRLDPKNTCLAAGCWDYVNGKIELIGKACSDYTTIGGQVKLRVGCPTVTG